MSALKDLEKLIKDEVLIEIEDYIDELFETIAAKKEDDTVKEELANMQEMKDDFNAMLEDIKNDEMSEEEALDIIEEINEFMQD